MRFLLIVIVSAWHITTYGQSTSYRDSLISVIQDADDTKELGFTLDRLIWSYRRDATSAEPYLNRYEALAEKLNNDYFRVKSNYLRGTLYRIAGRFSEAITPLKKSVTLLRETPDNDLLANVTYQIGALYNAQARYNESYEILLESLKLFEESGDEASQALVLNVIAVGHKKIGRYGDAEATMIKALRLYEKMDSDVGQADVLHNLGNFYAEQKEYEKALEYYKKQEILDLKTNYEPGLGYLYHAVGVIHSNRGDEVTANVNFKKAKAIWEKIESRKQEAETLISLGINEARLGNSSLGLTHLNNAIQIGVDQNDQENIQNAYQGYSEVYELNGNYRVAHQYFKKYEGLKDSLRSTSVTTQINNLNASYESEKKEQEIALLKSENKLKDTELKKKRLQQGLLTAVSLFIISTLIISSLYFNQRKKLKEKKYQQKINNQVNAIDRLIGRISELLDQKDKIELRPLHDINELIENQLTEKEYEVLSAIAHGSTNKEIALEQFISENTVKFHLKNIFSKLDVSNRKAAVKKIVSLVSLSI